MRTRFCFIALLTIAIGCVNDFPPGEKSKASNPIEGDVPSIEISNETSGSDQSTVPSPVKLAVHHLPNAFRITPSIISGGLPEGENAFAELDALGVKTIISVDGMQPDVELARAHGQRYVHLPHGYDGVPEQRGHEIAKAISELPGPIYIHCHHGKHRSPAAAAVACVEAGLIPAASAETILKHTGTGENYRGLWDSARNAKRLAPEFLKRLEVEFVEVASVPPLAMAMVAMEQTFDRLKQAAAADWKPPVKYPDFDLSHEALILKEQFAEMKRLPEMSKGPEKLLQYLTESEDAAGDLEQALREVPASVGRANSAMSVVTKSCIACHREFRDPPRPVGQRGEAFLN